MADDYPSSAAAPMVRAPEPDENALEAFNESMVRVASDPWTHMGMCIALSGLTVQAVIWAAPAVAVMAGMGAAAFLISAVYKATPTR